MALGQLTELKVLEFMCKTEEKHGGGKLSRTFYEATATPSCRAKPAFTHRYDVSESRNPVDCSF